MPRPPKKEINLSKESMLALMQEIYNELVEQRNTAIRIQNKMLTMMKEPEDMAMIGPIIEKQQKIINDCVEKKLTLSKLQSNMWQKNTDKEEDFIDRAVNPRLTSRLGCQCILQDGGGEIEVTLPDQTQFLGE